MSEQQSKAVLWDLDGTIIDSVTVMHEILDEVFPEFGIEKLTRAQIRAGLYGGLEESLARYSNNHPDQTSLLGAFMKAQYRHYLEEPVMFEQVLSAISDLGGFGVGQAIVTSRSNDGGRGPGGAHAIVRNSRLNEIIDIVISADECDYHKPHPQPIWLALEKLSINPEDAVMVGDQPVDAIAARQAGVHSILIDHENTEEGHVLLKESNPDVIIQEAEAILPYIKKQLALQ